MERKQRIIKIAIIGVLINIVFVGIKLLVAAWTNSLAIRLDAINNLGDVLSSVITVIGTKLASRGADKEHPGGHGRIEYLATLSIAVIIISAGVLAFWESIKKIRLPLAAEYAASSLYMIAFAIVMKLAFGNFMKTKGRQLEAATLEAAGMDALFDAVISSATLLSALINIIFNFNIDGYVGLAIAVVIVISGIGILNSTLKSIIGKVEDDSLIQAIKDKVASHDLVRGAYDLMLHNYGPGEVLGSIFIEVDDDMKAREVHALTKEIHEAIEKEYGVDITIGIYSSNVFNSRLSKMKIRIENCINKHREARQVHAFYVDSDKKKVSFDLVIDAGSKNVEYIVDEIRSYLNDKYEGYEFDISVDKFFA